MYYNEENTIFDKIFPIMILSLFVIFISGISYCLYSDHKTEKIEYAKQNQFFNGYHKIYNLSSKAGYDGKLSGNIWNINGSLNETENIRFIWVNEDTNELIPTVLPANKVKFILTDENTDPIVEFSWWNTYHYGSFEYRWIEYICNAKIYINKKHIDSNMYIKFGSN